MLKNTGIAITPDDKYVIIRPYVPHDQSRVSRIALRVMALEESAAEKELKKIRRDFSARHHNFDKILKHQFEAVRTYLPSDLNPSETRKLLIGACFVGERTFESAALFNPSIVAHPDQSEISSGSLRVIISLRATSEGHISTLTFRSGIIDKGGLISIDKVSNLACTAEPKANALYDKTCFIGKLYEMGLENDCAKYITDPLPAEFTIAQLENKIDAYIIDHDPIIQTDKLTCEKILWLARCNYEVTFDSQFTLS